MGFSYSKLTLLRPQKEKWLSTFLFAIISSAAFFVPYMIMSEGYFTFFGDFNVQQIPFYQMCHEAVKTGNINWSWTTDLGSNFVGSYSFYLLGSPFFWLTIPFPNWMVPYLMGPLLILKFGCAALTAYFFIRRFSKTSNAARLGGLLYAFSGFSVYNIFFNHFHEAIIYFPLLLLALELLITENRRGVFAVVVCLCAVSNYFFFFGMVVFTVIYFFVRLFSNAIKITFTRFLAVLLEAVLGVALAAAVLIPSFLAIADNSRVSSILLGWNGIMYGKEQIYLNIIECFFFPPDLPARPVFFPGADVKWSSLGGWLPVFSMVGVFTLFIHKKGNWMKRLIGICTFMSLVPILNSAFYAFNTSYYARWFYMPILIMCLATAMLSEDRKVDFSSGYKWVLGITLAFSLVIGLFPQKDDKGKIIFGLYTQSDDNMYLPRLIITCFIAIVGLVVLKILLNLRKTSRTQFFQTATVCVCAFSILYGNVFVAMGRSHSYEIKDVMIDQLIEGDVKLDDKSNFRIDVFDGVDNTGMYLDLPTINAFHSVVPTSITDFYNFVGEERSVASRPTTENYALRPLLSVKYLLNRTDGKLFVENNADPAMPGYEYLKTSGGYYVYENTNYIPYGFSYDYYMNYEFCEGYDDGSRAALMLKAMLLTDEQIKKYGSYFKNIENLKYNYNYDSENQSTTIAITDESFIYDCEQLRKTSADGFLIDNNGFSAKVTRESNSLVFFSVPYDEGWTATVNGVATDIEKVNVGFMAVPVSGGQSTIVFTYKTPGLIDGIFITISAALIFLIYFIACHFFVNKKDNTLSYPEGDILLKEWREDDIYCARTEFDNRIEDIDINDPRSILDDIPINIPKIDEGFSGGFKIDTSLLDDENTKNDT